MSVEGAVLRYTLHKTKLSVEVLVHSVPTNVSSSESLGVPVSLLSHFMTSCVLFKSHLSDYVPRQGGHKFTTETVDIKYIGICFVKEKYTESKTLE